jgi:hypothetical protein
MSAGQIGDECAKPRPLYGLHFWEVGARIQSRRAWSMKPGTALTIITF